MYKCEECQVELNSQSQWDAHIQGSKHAKAIARLSVQESLKNVADFSSAVLQPNGAYKCNLCENFVCTGIVPLSQHLIGSLHHKNAVRYRLKTTNIPRPLTESKQHIPQEKDYKVTPEIKTATSEIHSNGVEHKQPVINCVTHDKVLADVVENKQQLTNSFTQDKVLTDGVRNKQLVINSMTQDKVSADRVENKQQLTNSFTQQEALTAEQSIIKARMHTVNCGFKFEDHFSAFSQEEMITVLSDHFGFIRSNEKIPSFKNIIAQ